ncbi:MAG: hypothetical protein LBP34_02290 [Flavobacteriaceae bacterium]|jgi:hypothetical protein|nr:hypothetical protein [Flavobacteriaceae bacterium]
MKRLFLYFTINILCFAFGQESETKNFSLKNGDLIFQEAYSENMSKAIKEVTAGIEGYNFTHVGMVWIDSLNTVYVIDATEPQVRVIPLREFLYPEKKNRFPKSVVGRLKETYQPLIPQAIKEALKQVGKGYDRAFNPNNDLYYCSELIYFAFYKANHNQAVFPLNAMTFKSSNGEYSSYWTEHFRKLNIPIPEGEPGTNPGAMSQSEVIDIVHYFDSNAPAQSR